MDISLREWLIIGGVLVVVLILIDGWRRVNANRNRLRLEIDSRLSDLSDGDDTHANPELPNGGARRCTLEPEPESGSPSSAAPSLSGSGGRQEQVRKEPVFGDENPNTGKTASTGAAVQAELREMDPLFDDIPVNAKTDQAPSAPAAGRTDAVSDKATASEPTAADTDTELLQAVEEGEIQGASLDLETAEKESQVPDSSGMELDFEQPIPILYDKLPSADSAENSLAEYKRSLQESRKERQQADQRREVRQKEAAAGARIEPDLSALDRTELALDEPMPNAPEPPASEETVDVSEETPQKPRLGLRNPPDPENVLIITVVGRNNQRFPGPALHRIVSACGMEWGDMSLYHRAESDQPGAAVQFSMANGVAPGTFDPENLEALETPAVSFFMSMNEPEDPMNAYECMLATAETLAKHLDGDLLDENRSVMRPQTKEHYRERIREFLMHNRTRPVH